MYIALTMHPHHTTTRHLHKTRVAGPIQPLVADRAATGSSPPGAVANGMTPGAGLRDAWADLLSSYPWDCFATLTFAKARRDAFEVAKMFDIWLARWCFEDAKARGELEEDVIETKDGYGRLTHTDIKRKGPFWNRWRRGRHRPVYVLGIEEHSSPHRKGCFHCHAVLKFTGYEANRRTGWSTWFNKKPLGYNLGRARIEPPRDQEDVRAYCAKYVTKEQGNRGLLKLSESFKAVQNAVRRSPALGA